MDYFETMRQVLRNKAETVSGGRRSPLTSGTAFPIHRPKFELNFAESLIIFTIGSCFARNIEEALAARDVLFPTANFRVPYEEWPTRPNGLLNEYNPGSIAQRIVHAVERRPLPEETLVPGKGDLFADLLLPGGSDVTFARALERRAEIDNVYHMPCEVGPPHHHVGIRRDLVRQRNRVLP